MLQLLLRWLDWQITNEECILLVWLGIFGWNYARLLWPESAWVLFRGQGMASHPQQHLFSVNFVREGVPASQLTRDPRHKERWEVAGQILVINAQNCYLTNVYIFFGFMRIKCTTMHFLRLACDYVCIVIVTCVILASSHVAVSLSNQRHNLIYGENGHCFLDFSW